MKLTFKIIVIFIFFLFVAVISIGAAYTLKEEVNVYGTGNLTAETNAEHVQDSVVGNGEQYYYRELVSEPDLLSLTSNYNLKSDNLEKRYYAINRNGFKGISTDYYQAYTPNHYSIGMKNPSGLEHVISVYGFSGPNVQDLTSSSTVTFSNPTFNDPNANSGVATNYNIEGAGLLSESVLNSGVKKHIESIAGMRISSPHFKVSSQVADGNGLLVSDESALSDKVADVVITTEKGAPNSSVINHEAKIDSFLALLNTDFETGAITESDFLNNLGSMYNNGDINATVYLGAINYEVTKGKIDVATYNKIKNDTLDIEMGKINVDTQAKDLENKFNNGQINKTQYLDQLHQWWKEGQLNGMDWLGKLKLRLTEKVNITQGDYDAAKNEYLDSISPS